MKFAQDIIIKPIITENSMMGIADKKYTFQVAKDANKIELAKAVEELFGVKVRFRRQGIKGGYTPATKKAIVTLTADSKGIEFFESMN